MAERTTRKKSSGISPRQSGRKLLHKLLMDRNQYPDLVAGIDEELRRTFEQRVAVLVLDMVGFSRLTVKHGNHSLSRHDCADGRGRAAGHYGKWRDLIKQEADNLFAIYDTPAQALESALDILRAFEAVNTVVPEDRDIHGSIGIGFGDILVIGKEDLFGSEVNLASKLGEDLARKNEILLTPSAHKAIPPDTYQFTPAVFTISGMEMECQRYEDRKRPREVSAT